MVGSHRISNERQMLVLGRREMAEGRGRGHPSMSIGQLAALTGVSSRTIRYYEELGILPPPPRSAGGTRKYPGVYRYYVEGALALKEMGFALDEIRLLGAAALGMPLSARQRDRAAAAILAKERAFEVKVRMLRRLRDVLDAQRAAGADGGPAPLPVDALVALFQGALREAAGLADPAPGGDGEPPEAFGRRANRP
jgi:DNA-binding transcriptional MerR regulator